MKKKNLCSILAVCLIVPCMVVLPACGEHEHTFSQSWTTNDTHHWYSATCEHTDEKDSYAEHVYSNDTDATCNTCDYERVIPHSHSFAQTWTTNDTHHWYSATCEHTDEKDSYAEHVYSNDTDTICNTCEYERVIPHSHSFAQTWNYDESQHWYECECEAKDSVTNHDFTYNGICSACNYNSGMKHVNTINELNSAITSGGLIKIDSDIDLGNFTGDKLVVAEGVSVTIDLNGKTISGRNSNEKVSSALFANKGTLVINDSSTNKTGKIIMTDTGVRDYSWAHGIFTIKNTGTLVINGGTIENAGTTDVPYAIDNDSTSKDVILTLNGGNIVAHNTAIRLFANSTTKENQVVIEDGTVTGGTSGIWVQQSNGNAHKAELVVNGGTIYGQKYNGIYLDVNNNENGGAVSLKVTGGTIKNNSATEGTISINDRLEQSLANTSVNVEITDGTFCNENGGPAFACLYGTLNTTHVSITGGVFSADPISVVPTATGYTVQ